MSDPAVDVDLVALGVEHLAFAWEMLAAAATAGAAPLPVAEVQAEPTLAHYLDGWGRPGDAGLVAAGPDGVLLGAAWFRSFTVDDPGYGFVDAATPEVSIACVPEARGLGLGHRLIEGLLDLGHRAGIERLSLSVLTANVVGRRVYEDCGFVDTGEVHGDGGAITMVAPTRPLGAGGSVAVAPVAPGALDPALLARSAWGAIVASAGVVHDLTARPALVASIDGSPAGLLSWHVDGDQLEVLGLEAWVPGRGVGAALLRAARAEALAHGCRRLWLITNNDNIDALRFYQRRGWELVAVHRGGADRSRALKPSIPSVGDHGIPVHHEVELEFRLP